MFDKLSLKILNVFKRRAEFNDNSGYQNRNSQDVNIEYIFCLSNLTAVCTP